MANFFEKINKAGQETVQKVKENTEINKITSLIQAEEKEKEKVFADIGRKYYEVMLNGSEVDEAFAHLFSLIAQSCEKISSFQAEILKIKNVKRCPKCGRECTQDSVFCAGCGTQLPQEDNAIVGNHCVKCGAELAPDDAFCFNCGNKIEK